MNIKVFFLILFILINSTLNAQSIIKVLNGTGFFISPTEIVTAHHAIVGWENKIIPISYDNNQNYAKVTKYNSNLDIAYLSVNNPNKNYIQISNLPLTIGQKYTLYGYPSNANRAFREKHGVIKDLNFKFFSTTGRRTWERVVNIGTSGASDGFSGGPLIDNNGKAIGVLTNGDIRNAYFTSFYSLYNNNEWVIIE